MIVTTRDGRELSHREQVNRGADLRPLSGEEVIAKFRANAEMACAPIRAEELLCAVMDLDGGCTPEQVAELVLVV